MLPVTASSHYVERDSVRLHHLDWGNEGSHPIVLVHGSRLHAHVWNDFSRRFKDRFHVVAVDQRGHGDSGWCTRQGYALEDLYQDLRAVIEARGLKRYTLIGHSLGGRVSMLYASRHAAELDRLVLVDITPGRPNAQAGTERDFSRITETPGPGDFESHEAAIDYLGKLLWRAPAHLIEESVRHGMRSIDGGRYTWKYDPALVTRRVPTTMDMYEAVKTIPTPTLLLYGSHSNVVSPELAQRLQQTMPNCSVERVENAGHALFTDQPDVFAAAVERFLAS
jgi:pimeloyl-ACP methyl ester carboxylesterase